MVTGIVTIEEQKIIIELRESGIGYKKIANVLGCEKGRVAHWCRRNGYAGMLVDTALSEEDVAKRINEFYPDYRYAGGYTGSDRTIELECLKCGHSFSYNAQILRPSRDKNVICDGCAENKKEIEKLRKEVSRLIRKIKKEGQKLERLKEIKTREKTITCPGCAKEFTTTSDIRKFCSKTCASRMHGRNRDILRRLRINNNGEVDKDISIELLIERDGNKCHICGEECKKEDHRFEGDIFICGPLYPTIDHVHPISKGGTHTWDNVKLAHHICNSVKRDKTRGYKPNT